LNTQTAVVDQEDSQAGAAFKELGNSLSAIGSDGVVAEIQSDELGLVDQGSSEVFQRERNIVLQSADKHIVGVETFKVGGGLDQFSKAFAESFGVTVA